MPEEFNSAYQPEVDKWIRSTLKKEELFELPKCTQDTQPRMLTPTVRTPAHTNAFADDVAKNMIVKDPKDQTQKIKRTRKKVPSGNEEFGVDRKHGQAGNHGAVHRQEFQEIDA